MDRLYAANEAGDTVVTFAVEASGKLAPTGQVVNNAKPCDDGLRTCTLARPFAVAKSRRRARPKRAWSGQDDGRLQRIKFRSPVRYAASPVAPRTSAGGAHQRP